ncbi:hypothetical protein QUF55_10245 [Clostridiaceae bacterium HSG29]|nr:hypothetical protein [Clostridiaceae bacterium HSG29]
MKLSVSDKTRETVFKAAIILTSTLMSFCPPILLI